MQSFITKEKRVNIWRRTDIYLTILKWGTRYTYFVKEHATLFRCFRENAKRHY